MIDSVIVMSAPPGYLRASEVAIRLGVSPRVVCYWVHQQRLRGGIYHRVCLVDEASFIEFVKKGYTKNSRRKPWSQIENLLKEIFPEGLGFL